MLNINEEKNLREIGIKNRIKREKLKNKELMYEMQCQAERYEGEIKKLMDQRQEASLELTVYYHKKVECLEAELKTSA